MNRNRCACQRPVRRTGFQPVSRLAQDWTGWKPVLRLQSCVASILTVFLLAVSAFAGDPPKSDDDLRREAAIAEFTAKTKAANYPALFDAAAAEFNVPADVLKGISFAETRWEQLKWPPGETASPETGMPRPYGIMSLWDNKYFGHSLLEAAALIGKDPDVLKEDPLQNMRGAAALLRKIYDENPKPDGTTESDIESWRYAIRKYCGIPEPDLNARHALEVYVWMTKGYHEYGIEWNARPVNLEPIRAETKRIVQEEKLKREAQLAANSGLPQLTSPPPPLGIKPVTSNPPPPVVLTESNKTSIGQEKSFNQQPRLLWGMILALLAAAIYIGVLVRGRSKSRS